MSVDTAQEAIGSSSASEEPASALNQVSTIIGELSMIASRISESMGRLNRYPFFPELVLDKLWDPDQNNTRQETGPGYL